MAVTFEVERLSDSERDSLCVSYGWAHFHALAALLAAEEGIDLPVMSGYGGVAQWVTVDTSLRPLFDMDSFKDGRLTVSEFGEMPSRLHEISESWSRGTFAGAAEIEMKSDQALSLRKLVAVVDTCVATGRSLVLR